MLSIWKVIIRNFQSLFQRQHWTVHRQFVLLQNVHSYQWVETKNWTQKCYKSALKSRKFLPLSSSNENLSNRTFVRMKIYISRMSSEHQQFCLFTRKTLWHHVKTSQRTFKRERTWTRKVKFMSKFFLFLRLLLYQEASLMNMSVLTLVLV